MCAVVATVMDVGLLIEYVCPFCNRTNRKGMRRPKADLRCDGCGHVLRFVVAVTGGVLPS